ncbi:fructose PTS transporter subunit IIA [Clostridium sp. AL.422]|uniref:PTS sugar transporter subunit IIA n=1 Tax=Clostridium TaxID=1485 RepID=UPI00293DE068|nr:MULTISPECIES: fructose PTS transporter subunit IIA [unclassified Clostridium]MDV4151394.1 fructose PTS transporter subunit IIA [Clostridium sp. AL.422]
MDIKEMITQNTVEFDIGLNSQIEVLKKITDILMKDSRSIDRTETLNSYIARENECTTGIGFGIAIPHCKSESIIKPTIVYLKLKKSVDWNSLDGEPVNVVIGLAIPKNDEGTLHLEILSSLASNLMDDDFKNFLFSVDCKDNLIEFLYNNLI